MLTHREDPRIGPKIASEVTRSPALARVLEVFESAPEVFAIDPDAEGVELIPVAPGSVPASRCRLKFFTPRQGSDRICAFFHKKSNLAWSRDRFSYGGVEFRPEQLTEEGIRSWLAWLCSGFDPAMKPDRLRRSFLYDVPE